MKFYKKKKKRKKESFQAFMENLKVALFRCHIASLEFSKEFLFNIVFIVSS